MGFFAARVLVSVALVGAAALTSQSGAQAYTLKTLYSFCSKANCRDGRVPHSRPVMDASGNLYLTVGQGGKLDVGAVVELVKKHKNWTEKVLHSFSNQKGDGAIPVAGPVLDVSGNLYGTTVSGGAGGGVVYELRPRTGSKSWAHKTLYEFCRGGSPCPDGRGPLAPLTYAGAASGALYDGVSPLYGTTPDDGLSIIAGTVFELVPGGGKWTQTTIYQFCASANCADGEEPRGGVVLDGSGRLLGTTWSGGQGGVYGVVFALTPSSGSWNQSVLYNFCSAGSQCPDGFEPVAGVTTDVSGNIFGTTSGGGVSSSQCSQYFSVSTCGTVYELDTSGHESVLYGFCAQTACADGAMPYSTLTPDSAGDLIGTTFWGGTGAAWDSGRAGSGTVFAQHGTTHTVLYSFCVVTSQCLDGADPEAGVFVDGAGNIYGTTSAGGANGMGTVFELSP